MNRLLKILSVLAVCLTGTAANATEHIVEMTDTPPYFTPASLTVQIGDTVVWKNHGPVLVHIIITEDLSLYSDDVDVKKDWSYTFKKAGVYSYTCFRHFFMHGEVIVKNADGSTVSQPDYPYQVAFHEMIVPTMGAVPRMVIADQKRHAIWFTEGGGDFYGFEGLPAQNKLGRIDPQGNITEFATPTPNSDGSKVGVDSLVLDPDGTVWFTERITNRIGRLDKTGLIKEFQLPRPDGYALGIDIDSEGTLWFAERYGNSIGYMSKEGAATEIELPEKESEPRTVFVGSGGKIWYTARVANEIGYYDVQNKTLKRLTIPTKLARPVGICETSDHTIYFLEMVGNKVAKVNGDQITEYPLPTKFAAPFKCVADSKDNIWFSEVYGNAIGVLHTSDGSIEEYKIPTSDSRPGGVTVDEQGRVWFTEQKGNKIAYFDPSYSAKLQPNQNPVARTTTPAEQIHGDGEASTAHRMHHSAEGDPSPVRSKPISYNPAADATIKNIHAVAYPLPNVGSGPGNDLIEEGGGLWFPEVFGNRIGRLDLESKSYSEITLPREVSMPVGIAHGPENHFWSPLFRANSLAEIDPVAGTVIEHPLPIDGALPSGVTISSDGEVWITEFGANRIARYDRKSKKFQETELPLPDSSPLQIIADGPYLWISASDEDRNYVTRFSLATKEFEVFPVPTKVACPVGMLRDGPYLWVAEGAAGKLGRLTVATRQWKEISLPGERPEPVKLSRDPQGNLWITDGGGLGSSGGNKVICYHTATGNFDVVEMEKREAKPMGILARANGSVWFTQQGNNALSVVEKGVTSDGNI